MLIHVQFELHNFVQIIMLYVTVLICNLSAAMTLAIMNHQIFTFYSLLKYQVNLTCDSSILKYTAHVIFTVLVILNVVYPNIAW